MQAIQTAALAVFACGVVVLVAALSPLMAPFRSVRRGAVPRIVFRIGLAAIIVGAAGFGLPLVLGLLLQAVSRL